jgi:hypothetical protein
LGSFLQAVGVRQASLTLLASRSHSLQLVSLRTTNPPLASYFQPCPTASAPGSPTTRWLRFFRPLASTPNGFVAQKRLYSKSGFAKNAFCSPFSPGFANLVGFVAQKSLYFAL